MGINELGGCCSGHPVFTVSGKSFASLVSVATALVFRIIPFPFTFANSPSTPKRKCNCGFIFP